MSFEPVIGLEVHAQLQTHSKMFCRCSSDYAGAEPNSHICPICAGFPGVLPVVNEQAVELALRVGLALNCEIAPVNRFDRKHYGYPDLPKGYQITQYDLPIAQQGHVDLPGGRRVGIVRVHMEEDTGRLLHRRASDGGVYSLVDLNRAGVPLLEIVSGPDLRSAAEAREYVTKLRQILRYIGASTGNMEEGALRVDANVSVRPSDEAPFGAKVEIKNLNSFRMVERAIQHEIERQVEVLESGGSIQQETRGWDDAAAVTLPQRTKEYAHDYRYLPEPDLPPLSMDEGRVAQTRTSLAELPEARAARFVSEYGISEYDAQVLTAGRETADYFESAVGCLGHGLTPKVAANWITGELFRLARRDNISPSDSNVTPELLCQVLHLVQSGEVTAAAGKQLLEHVHVTGRSPRELADEHGLRQISGGDELVQAVRAALEANPRAVADFRRGKRQAADVLVGHVMKQTRGRARADAVRELILSELESASAR